LNPCVNSLQIGGECPRRAASNELFSLSSSSVRSDAAKPETTAPQ
jgi:hypothetical protein